MLKAEIDLTNLLKVSDDLKNFELGSRELLQEFDSYHRVQTRTRFLTASMKATRSDGRKGRFGIRTGRLLEDLTVKPSEIVGNSLRREPRVSYGARVVSLMEEKTKIAVLEISPDDLAEAENLVAIAAIKKLREKS